MRLEEYLRALEACPDESVSCDGRQMWRLTTELGVYDNFPIFLRGNFDKFVAHLESANYNRGKSHSESGLIRLQFFYAPGTVDLQVINYLLKWYTTGGGMNETEEIRKHFERQTRDYNITVLLHPYQETKMAEVNWTRAFAMVIKDISSIAVQNQLGLCFPRSIGWNNKKDYSRIVYYPDETPVPTQT